MRRFFSGWSSWKKNRSDCAANWVKRKRATSSTSIKWQRQKKKRWTNYIRGKCVGGGGCRETRYIACNVVIECFIFSILLNSESIENVILTATQFWITMSFNIKNAFLMKMTNMKIDLTGMWKTLSPSWNKGKVDNRSDRSDRSDKSDFLAKSGLNIWAQKVRF